MATKAARRNAERWASNREARENNQMAGARLAEAPRERRDGLEWLRGKRHISAEEYEAGLWYADRYRWAHMEGSVPISSVLSGERGSGCGGMVPADLLAAERIAQAAADFIAIEARIGWDVTVHLTLLTVCVHGKRLTEAEFGRAGYSRTIGALKTTLGHIAQVRQERGKKDA